MSKAASKTFSEVMRLDSLEKQIDEKFVAEKDPAKLQSSQTTTPGEWNIASGVGSFGFKRMPGNAMVGDQIVMLLDKCGMVAGTRATICGSNQTQWQLDNGKTVQHNQCGDAWERCLPMPMVPIQMHSTQNFYLLRK